MQQKSPAFQWYPKDHLASIPVALLSLTEEAAYRRAMDYCWINGSIPADIKQLARLIGKGCTTKIAQAIQALFVPNPENAGQLVHQRLMFELEKQNDFHAGKSEAGIKGNAKRWGKKETDPQDFVRTQEPIEEMVEEVEEEFELDFAIRLMSADGALDRENIEIGLAERRQLTEEDMTHFKAHLHTEGVVHTDYSKFTAHLRNWLNMKPTFSHKTATQTVKPNSQNPVRKPKGAFTDEDRKLHFEFVDRIYLPEHAHELQALCTLINVPEIRIGWLKIFNAWLETEKTVHSEFDSWLVHLRSWLMKKRSDLELIQPGPKAPVMLTRPRELLM